MNSELPNGYVSWNHLDSVFKIANLHFPELRFVHITGTTAHFRNGILYIYKDGVAIVCDV